MTDLAKLIEAVEEGSIDFNEFLPRDNFDMMRKAMPIDDWGVFVKAYEGSVDAAIALMAELLGDRWGFVIREGFAKVQHPKTWRKDIAIFDSITSRALLTATLKALEWDQLNGKLDI